MKSYIRVDQKDKTQPQNKDEIRIRGGDYSIYPYLSYAHRHFSQGNQRVIVKATGNAIPKAVQVIELMKRRFQGLHQQNEITTLDVQDVYEPIVQGLDTVVRSRKLTMLQCTLSKEPQDPTHYGYQTPLPPQEIQQFFQRPPRGANRPYRSGPNDGYRDERRGGYGRGGYNNRGRGFRGGRGYGRGDRNYDYNNRRNDYNVDEDYDNDYQDHKERGRGFSGGARGLRSSYGGGPSPRGRGGRGGYGENRGGRGGYGDNRGSNYYRKQQGGDDQYYEDRRGSGGYGRGFRGRGRGRGEQ